MAQKRVTISIDSQINDRWTHVSKRHKITKSGMVEEYLEQILPILEAETPNKMVAKAMKEMGKSINLTATLFDDMKHDQSIEDYKEMKRG
jgi:hypothetical protein